MLTRPPSHTCRSRRDEDWRWTDLRGLIRVAPEPSPPLTNVVQPGGPFRAALGDEVVIANGRLNWWPDEPSQKGVQIFEYDSPDPPRGVEGAAMAHWAAALATDPPVTILELDGQDPTTIRLRWVSDANGTAHHGRLGIVIKQGASALLFESYEGKGGGYLANHLVEIFVEPGGRLERLVALDDVSDAISVSTSIVELLPGASFHQTVLASGAKRQRFETRVRHHGGGGSVQLDGAYVLAGQRHSDQTTLVDHLEPDGVTSQLTKGVVQDQARGVFQGRIVVAEGADGADARMGHHALILSDRAEVDAKPELEIWADDVACAHGNTVGALDEDALFYARSRGIPEPEARALLVGAFLGEAADRIEHIQARELAHEWIAARLRGAA